MRVCVPFYGKIKIHIFILVEKATQVSKKKKKPKHNSKFT